MYVLALFANPGPGGQILHLNSIQPLADGLTCCYYYYQKTIAAVNSFTGHSLKRLQGGETIIKLIRPWEEAFKSMVIPCKAAATCISDNIGKNCPKTYPYAPYESMCTRTLTYTDRYHIPRVLTDKRNRSRGFFLFNLVTGADLSAYWS